MGNPSLGAGPVGFALLVGAMLALPVASASGAADAIVLVAYVEDGHGLDCTAPVAGFCFFNVTGMEEGVGNATIDASQSLNYVGVATNLSLIREPAGDLWKIPDEDVTIYASQHYAKHPVFRTMVETWQNQTEGRWPVDQYWVNMSSEHVTVECYCPGTADGGDVTQSQIRTYRPTPWSEHCITYEHVGPCNAYNSTSADSRVNGNLERLCLVEGVPCDTVLLPAVSEAQNQTPNVIVGLQYYEAQVATDPSNLTMGSSRNAPTSMTHAPRWRNATQPAVPVEEERNALDPLPGPQPPQPPGLLDVTVNVPPPPDGGQGPQPQMQQGLPQARLPLHVIVAATAALGFLALVVWAVLYSRFASKKDLLASPVRRQIIQLAGESPGIHMQELASRLGLTRQTVAHHVLLLQRAHLLEVVRDEWKTRLYVPGTTERQENHPGAPQGFTLLCQHVLSLLREAPNGLARKELQDALGDVPKRKRNKILHRLIRDRLVQEVEDERGEKRLRLLAPSSPSEPTTVPEGHDATRGAWQTDATPSA